MKFSETELGSMDYVLKQRKSKSFIRRTDVYIPKDEFRMNGKERKAIYIILSTTNGFC